MKIRAAVTAAKSAPFEIEDLDLDEPRAGEIVIQLAATGICHSDIGAREQYLPLPLPMVFGHEGAGVVTALGANVTKVRVGDHVVLSRLTCGQCPACVRGNTNMCDLQGNLNLSGGRPDGSTGLSRGGEPIYGRFFGQSSFATYCLAHERNVTRIDPDFDLTLAPAFACGVLTGAGTVLHGPQPSLGSSIAVFGAGTVGLAAIMAARAAGYRTIIAVDRAASRLELASELGATHTITADDRPLAAMVRAIVPRGVAFTIEATGVPSVVRAAVESLESGGECALLGVGPMEQEVSFNHMQLAFSGVAVRGYPTGLSEPDELIPQLMELYCAGSFPVDRLVTRYPFERIEEAAQDSAQGAAIKPVLIFA
ncbi:NAD(P)-dependent alcohol dehydrogenase [Nocardia sp. CA2R105]|uniref:NAD(P)-dependent alcohol dehydrogenase n=1 Tax=Nocardia coffeae TaxID=2873381 RepID=UPI001CA615A9|nr:NAD(P)-dependent alcohol dehydrogenase [Nocardia coffeae]MBY8863404.1 NAD(P)-dependent alcohol dehydrogenase [Nocardia coffeae]